MNGTAPLSLLSTEPPPCAGDPEWHSALSIVLRARRCFLATTRAVDPNGSEAADTMQEARVREEEQLWLTVVDRSEGARAWVVEALSRVAAGRYGLCIGCVGPIPAERLRTLPFAVRCLPCQERFEAALEDGVAPSTAAHSSLPVPAEAI